MPFPLTITFRDLKPSPAIEGFVRRWASRLETVYDRIERCQVVIERPHQHHRHGQRYHVRVTLAVPGPDVEVSRDHALDRAHEDLYGVRILCDGANLIDSSRLVASGLSGSIACG